MATISEYLNQLVRDKQKLVEYFTNQGFELTGNETITKILSKCTNGTCTHENKHQVGTWHYTGDFDSYCYLINYECPDCNETFSAKIQHDWNYTLAKNARGTIVGIDISCNNNACACSKRVNISDAEYIYYEKLYRKQGE